jgi:hypothetical protein
MPDVEVVVAGLDTQVRRCGVAHGLPPGVIDPEDHLVPVRLIVGRQLGAG